MVAMRDVQRPFGSGSMKNLSRACEVVPLVSALAQFGIASKEQARALEKARAEYRKQPRLDVEGKVEGSFRDVCNH
jgi:hypothetical protein